MDEKPRSSALCDAIADLEAELPAVNLHLDPRYLV